VKLTKKADAWLNTASRAYPHIIVTVVQRARAIARQRGSPRLGRVHLELALEKLAEEEAEDALAKLAEWPDSHPAPGAKE